MAEGLGKYIFYFALNIFPIFWLDIFSWRKKLDLYIFHQKSLMKELPENANVFTIEKQSK